MSLAEARCMTSMLVVAIACGCVIGCGGSVIRSNDPNATGGLGAAGGSSAGESAGGAPAGGGAAAGGAGGRAQGGTSSGGQGSGGATGGSAGECTVLNTPAYPVRFVLQTNTTVYVKESCTLEYELTSECTGLTPLTTQVVCAADCNHAELGCSTCGACFSGARAVTPSSPQPIDWSGEVYEYGTTPSGCSCATSHIAAPGKYTFSIDAYLSSDDAMTGANAFHHHVSFTLPAPNDTVIVDLGFIGI